MYGISLLYLDAPERGTMVFSFEVFGDGACSNFLLLEYGGYDLTLDLIEHDVRSYKGTFSLEVHRHHKRPTDYTITWESDTLSSDRQHNISYAHFKELEQYRTVRVTYWRAHGSCVEHRTFRKEVKG